MSVEDIDDRRYIIEAIKEFDRLGRGPFLEQYRYGPSRNIFLLYDGREYDAKAIVGVAHNYIPKSTGPLVNSLFNSRHDAEPLLRRLKFYTINKTIRNLETEYQRLVWLRKTQRVFSDKVKVYWRNLCAVTGIEAPNLLEACHIKPWTESSEAERLNPFNGLYLAVHIHAAFDANLIGIAPDGSVELSNSLTESDRAKLCLREGLKIGVDQQHRPFLKDRYADFLE